MTSSDSFGREMTMNAVLICTHKRGVGLALIPLVASLESVCTQHLGFSVAQFISRALSVFPFPPQQRIFTQMELLTLQPAMV